MPQQFQIPAEAFLDTPLRIPNEGLIDFDIYSAFARNRIRHVTAAEMGALDSYAHAEDVTGTSSALYAIRPETRWDISGPIAVPISRSVTALGIWVNRDYFSTDYSDLIPYSEAHEIYESWLVTELGVTEVDKAHLAARRHQLELAARDGNAENLVHFYLSDSPELEEELTRAYEQATGNKF